MPKPMSSMRRTPLGSIELRVARLLRLPARNIEIGELFDTYIACAVATIVVLRVYLQLTGFPKLGGNGLHIAHVLWGGLAMTLAIGILTGFISRRTRQLGAIVGGIGFGLFIDELGKFVTSDNNYFFRPTAVLLYGVFVLLFLLTRLVRQGGRFTPQEKLANVFELLKEAAIGDLDRHEQTRIRLLLRDCDDSEPWVPTLRRLVGEVEAIPDQPTWAGRAMRWIRRRAAATLQRRWLLWVLASVYVLQSVVTFIVVVALVLIAGMVRSSGLTGDVGAAGPTVWVPLAAGFASSVGSIAAAILIWRSRRTGLLVFEIAVLIDLFLVQPFSLLESQFAALAGVFIDLALLAVIRQLAHRERDQRDEHQLATDEAAAAPAS